MGMKIVSFLCGGFTRKKQKPPPSESEKPKPDSPEIPERIFAEPRLSSAVRDISEEQQPLPPPPGRDNQNHLRSASYSHQRSNSAVSKLAESMSVLVRIGGGASRREQKTWKHEDSIWKKTILLGEKCRVPDEDDDDAVMHDENGNRISAYHRRNAGSSTSFSRQNSYSDHGSGQPIFGS